MARLQVGQRCRLSPGGPIYTVERVTVCSAALATRQRREFDALNKRTGEIDHVVADGRVLIHVSPNAAVYPAEEVQDV